MVGFLVIFFEILNLGDLGFCWKNFLGIWVFGNFEIFFLGFGICDLENLGNFDIFFWDLGIFENFKFFFWYLGF